MNPRTVFMGSPEFALPTLQALAGRYNVVGVVTQPDRPAGRGRLLTPPPVKILAQALAIPVIQPEKMKDPEVLQQIQAWNPELIVVVAFGKILRPVFLDLPVYGCINVHASLLPRWRGAAPIPAAILNGDDHTGVTIMRLDPGVDTGPWLAQRSIPILPDDTAQSLGERLAQIGAGLLLETLPPYLRGELPLQAQDEALATYAPLLNKDDGRLDFSQPAELLARRVRAFNPWPGAFMLWSGQPLKIHRASAVGDITALPGQTVIHADLPAVGTASGLLVLDEVQPAGKKSMPGKVFLQGARQWNQPPHQP